MFPLQQHQETLIFDDLSSIGHDELLETLLAGHDVPRANNDLNNVNLSCKGKRKRKTQVTSVDQETKGIEGSKELKKVIHREVERQRRQEMSTLFASLRSLLPVEYIKGKRSTTEHMNEAVEYIKHMQKRIEAMQYQRKKLKSVSSSSSSGEEIINKSTNFVKLNQIGDEIEILISSDETFPVSKVLIELVGRDLNVLSCVSSKANERTLQRIQIQANESRRIDLLELQNYLGSLIKRE